LQGPWQFHIKTFINVGLVGPHPAVKRTCPTIENEESNSDSMNTFCFNQGNILLKMQLGKFYNFTNQLHKHPYISSYLYSNQKNRWHSPYILVYKVYKDPLLIYLWYRQAIYFVLKGTYTFRIDHSYLTGCQADASEVVGKAAELLKREANMVKLQVWKKRVLNSILTK